MTRNMREGIDQVEIAILLSRSTGIFLIDWNASRSDKNLIECVPRVLDKNLLTQLVNKP